MTPLLTTIAAVLTAIYIGLPFWRARVGAGEAAHQSQRDELELRREALLRDLKELEFDHRMGKIDDAEYGSLRAETAAAASEVLNQLEALRPRRAVSSVGSDAARAGLGVEIEVLVARARRRFQLSQSTLAAVAPTWACSCGRVMADSDRFCAACGTPRPAENVTEPGMAGNLAS